jgi:GxxExxY protein
MLKKSLAKLSIADSTSIRSLGPDCSRAPTRPCSRRVWSDAASALSAKKSIGIKFDGLTILDGFRADLIVDQRLIIEVKSLERTAPVHAKQLLTYLRLTEQPLGLLMNFGCATFREGVKRVVNGPSTFVPPSPRRA